MVAGSISDLIFVIIFEFEAPALYVEFYFILAFATFPMLRTRCLGEASLLVQQINIMILQMPLL